MSQVDAKKAGLSEAFARRTFVVFVSRVRDFKVLQSGRARGWTVPSSAQPGDRVLVYKPGKAAGWSGHKPQPPYEAFVAAGIVYGKPRQLEKGFYNAPLAEIQMFPSAVSRSKVANAFPEWKWLRSMQGMLGVEIPKIIETEFFCFVSRLGFSEEEG